MTAGVDAARRLLVPLALRPADAVPACSVGGGELSDEQLTSGLRVCVTGLANWVIYRVAVASIARDGTEGTPSHVEVRPRK